MLDARASEADCIRITVLSVRGSAPRDAGTMMHVWADGDTGTIGGGRLEFEAIRHARSMLDTGVATAEHRFALGPSLGQCCGGAVTLAFERVGSRPALHRVPTPERNVAARILRPIFIYGAGHVSRALAPALVSRARATVTVFDPRADQVTLMADHVTCISSRRWEATVSSTPANAIHYIMTPDHEVDLTLCHQLLSRGDFAFVGLIGSATKWARFQSRLSALGHAKGEIARITCPIGDPSLGKAPESIAAGVVRALLKNQAPAEAQGGPLG